MSNNMNRLANSTNPYQGKYKKVLCVCSAGLLRSPTAALVLSQEFNCNTRACGMSKEFALVPLDEVLLSWADLVVTMDEFQAQHVKYLFLSDNIPAKPVLNLDIEDSYSYRDPELMNLIREKYALYEASQEGK